MLKNCVFKDSVNTRKWMVNAGIRAVKTMAQTAVAVFGNRKGFLGLEWRVGFSFSFLGANVRII